MEVGRLVWACMSNKLPGDAESGCGSLHHTWSSSWLESLHCNWENGSVSLLCRIQYFLNECSRMNNLMERKVLPKYRETSNRYFRIIGLTKLSRQIFPGRIMNRWGKKRRGRIYQSEDFSRGGGTVFYYIAQNTATVLNSVYTWPSRGYYVPDWCVLQSTIELLFCRISWVSVSCCLVLFELFLKSKVGGTKPAGGDFGDVLNSTANASASAAEPLPEQTQASPWASRRCPATHCQMLQARSGHIVLTVVAVNFHQMCFSLALHIHLTK